MANNTRRPVSSSAPNAQPASADAVSFPAGFRFIAGRCGIKKAGNDVALVIADAGASCAAVFTTNRVQAAPVRLSRQNLLRSGGRLRAIITNSGNANCATGRHGLQAAQATVKAVAAVVGCKPAEVQVLSTGVIGVPLPYEKIVRAVPALARQNSGAQAVAQAILTTDTRSKIAHTTFADGNREYSIAGYAKGAGMIHPRMATMLAFLFTDAYVAPAKLQRALTNAVARSFNRITVDGDTSTNDTVLLAASGAVAGKLSAKGEQAFQQALNEVAESLARQIVLDGEGARHFVTVQVEGAASLADADKAARAIAHSPLVKTAIAGADANWGRVLAAAGYSGAAFDPERAQVWFSGIPVYRRGLAVPFDEKAAKRRLAENEVEIRIDLRAGKHGSWIWTCDLTEEYIRINGSYRT